MIKVTFTGRINKNYINLVAIDDTLKEIVDKRVIYFRKNPDDTRLRNHALQRRMKGKWSFSITDVRIIYEWMNKTTVRFLTIGKHEDVY